MFRFKFPTKTPQKKYILHFFFEILRLSALLNCLMSSLNLFSIKIFVVAIALSIIISGTTATNPLVSWIEGFAIFVAMIICVFVATFTEYQLSGEYTKLIKVFEDTKMVEKVHLAHFNLMF